MGRIDTCVRMAEVPHCSPETITALLIDYTPIQNKTSKKKKTDILEKVNYRNPDYREITLPQNKTYNIL